MKLPHKEHTSELKSYRLTALVNTIGKVFRAMLNKRLCKWIKRAKVLGEEKNGFYVERRAQDIIN